MLHAVMLGSGPGRGRHEWYPGFYLQRRRLGCRMNRAEQENIYRQSRQLTTIVPSHEDLVLSVLKSPISQHQHQHQHQQRQQHHPTHHSHGHHVNCQGHQNHKKCTHSGILGLAEETQFVLNGVTIGRFLAAHWNYRNTAGFSVISVVLFRCYNFLYKDASIRLLRHVILYEYRRFQSCL